jgi:hypothetical protein
MANFEPYSGYKFERTQFVARELLGGKVKKNKKNHQMHQKHQKRQYHRSSCPECESYLKDPAKGGGERINSLI